MCWSACYKCSLELGTSPMFSVTCWSQMLPIFITIIMGMYPSANFLCEYKIHFRLLCCIFTYRLPCMCLSAVLFLQVVLGRTVFEVRSWIVFGWSGKFEVRFWRRTLLKRQIFFCLCLELEFGIWVRCSIQEAGRTQGSERSKFGHAQDRDVRVSEFSGRTQHYLLILCTMRLCLLCIMKEESRTGSCFGHGKAL